MQFVCSTPDAWSKIWLVLIDEAKKRNLKTEPPRVLILGAWAMSDDYDRNKTWNDTIEWAKQNELLYLIPELKENEKYTVAFYTESVYKYWSSEQTPTKQKYSKNDVQNALKLIVSNWVSYLGVSFAENTKPIKLTGRKARRLLVYVSVSFLPPWGTWNTIENKKIFSDFRKKINGDMYPLEIDHIDFKIRSY